MNRLALVGLLVGTMAAGSAFAQTKPADPQAKPAEKTEKKEQTAKPAPAAPKPAEKPAPAAEKPAAAAEKPAGEKPAAPARQAMPGNSLGSVRLPKAMMADGTKLAAGSYQVRATDENATPPASGASPQLERYVEFLRGGKVVARAVASIVPGAEIKQVAESSIPGPGRAKVEMLKGGDYWRVWINKGGDHYLIHLPPA